MTLSVNRLVHITHSELIAAKIATPVTFNRMSLQYRKAVQEIATLVTSDIKLAELKKRVSKLAYFNFRNNSDKFAIAAFTAKEKLIEANKPAVEKETTPQE